MNMNLSKLQEIVKDRGTLHAAVHGVTKIGHDLATEQQQQSYFIPISRKLKKGYLYWNLLLILLDFLQWPNLETSLLFITFFFFQIEKKYMLNSHNLFK